MKNIEADEINSDKPEYRHTNISLNFDNIERERKNSNKFINDDNKYKQDLNLNKLELRENSPRKIDTTNSESNFTKKQNREAKSLYLPNVENHSMKNNIKNNIENDDDVQITHQKEIENDNNLIFTFKENERDKYNYKEKSSYDNAYILETEQNLKLFDKKYQEFKKNSVLHSSFHNELNSNLMTKFDEPNNYSKEIKNSYENNKLDKNECINCKAIIENLLLEKNRNLETIKNLQKSEKENQEKVDKYLTEIENLFQENCNKDQNLKKLNDDYIILKKSFELIKKEFSVKINTVNSYELNYNKLVDKYNDLEVQKIELEKNLSLLEYKFKNLKYDYQNAVKNSISLKKERDKFLEEYESLKSKQYNLEQDNIMMKTNQVKNEKQLVQLNKEIYHISKNTKQAKNIIDDETNNRLSKSYNSHFPNKNVKDKEIAIRSASTSGNLKENRNPMNQSYFQGYDNSTSIYMDKNKKQKDYELYRSPKKEECKLDRKLSQLLVQKSQIENEIIKLPKKQKNLIQINRKIFLDEELNQIEGEINRFRIELKSNKK